MAEKDRTQKKDEEQPAPDRAARDAVREADPEPEAEQFPKERLITDAASFLGYEPHEVAGALAGVNKKNLTIEEAQAATKAWLRSEVKED